MSDAKVILNTFSSWDYSRVFDLRRIDSWSPIDAKDVYDKIRDKGVTCSQEHGCWDIININGAYSGRLMQYLRCTDEFYDESLEYAALTAIRWFTKCQ